MTSFHGGLSSDVLQNMGWTLIHFLWQGLALGAMFAGIAVFCRSAATRYALGVSTLAFMLLAPVTTFLLLQWEGNAAHAWTLTSNARPAAPSIFPGDATRMPVPGAPAVMLLWVVEAWFAGVLLLSLRSAGGLLVIERLRCKESRPLRAVLLEKCLALQRRMGIQRVIQYCECGQLEAPAVIGWIRPMVLLPVTAITGLSEVQLEAVIVHELAHIWRWDHFVNLFQIAAETLLFYHPAVWWVSKRVREERENCCDDAAISMCGNVVEYARALTLIGQWREAPALAMAVNHSPLAARVMRLLGTTTHRRAYPRAGVSASCICMVGMVLACNALLGAAHEPAGRVASPGAAPTAIILDEKLTNRTDVREFRMKLDDSGGIVHLEFAAEIQHGSIRWELIDPKNAERMRIATTERVYGNTDRLKSMKGEWVLRLTMEDASGGSQLHWVP